MFLDRKTSKEKTTNEIIFFLITLAFKIKEPRRNDTGINKKQSLLEKENQRIIDDLGNASLKLFSLTPTKYDNLNITSIYSLLK